MNSFARSIIRQAKIDAKEWRVRIGANMRRRREDRRILQRVAADALGITGSMLSLIESGKRSATIERLCAVALVYECEPLEFLVRSGPARRGRNK